MIIPQCTNGKALPVERLGGNIQGTFREYSVNVQGKFRESGNI
jgi:hypothetical protein